MRSLQFAAISGRGPTTGYGPVTGPGSWVLGLALLLAAVLLTACGGPAPAPLIVDEGERLERSRVLEAAAPLAEQGVSIAVFVVEQGDSAGADADRRLANAGMLQEREIIPGGVAIYISNEPRYSELRVGTSWNSRLPKDTLEQIRQETLNPALRNGDYTGAVSGALRKLEAGVTAAKQQALLISWGGGIVVAGAVLFGAYLAFAATIERSPFGRLVAKGWALTPIGRRQARERREREVRLLRYDLSKRAQSATHVYQRLPFPLPEYQPQLDALERRNAELKERSAEDEHILKELRSLCQDYERFAKRVSAWKSSHDTLLLVAEQTHNQLGRVAAALKNPPPQRKNRRNPQNVSADGLTQLETLQARLLQLDQDQALFHQSQATASELRQEIEGLTKRYRALMTESLRLWRTELPGSYNQYMRSQQPSTSPFIRPDSTSDSYSSYASDTSSASSSSYDSPSSSDSSSSGESRAGGDW